MIKMVMPMKRKPGLSVAQFREYYETTHRLIGEKYLAGFAVKYVRRYVDAMPDRDGVMRDPDFDVLLEIWYPDQAAFDACRARLSEPDAAREIRLDEEELFDMGSMRSFVLEEHESEL